MLTLKLHLYPKHVNKKIFYSLYTNYRSLSRENSRYDVVIVGNGIVGTATALELSTRYPNLTFATLEKEKAVAMHQSVNNSGVVHAGIYYTPGTLKARLCVQGSRLMYDYMDARGIDYRKCGKLIAAVDQREVSRLDELYERAKKNGCRDVTMLTGEQVREIEPHCKAIKALHSPHTGITDYGKVTESLERDFIAGGGYTHFSFEVQAFRESPDDPEYPVTIISSSNKEVRCRYVVTCAGLFADRISELSGCSSEPRILMFRGEYLKLKDSCPLEIKGNIYPVPDPSLPFLGVHFTPRINGDVWLGPNAVLAFKREGYKWSDFSIRDFTEAVTYPGLLRLISRNKLFAADEFYRSLVLSAQVKKLRRFVPQLKTEYVELLATNHDGRAGVRAQALNRAGQLVEDFVFDSGRGTLAARTLHVRNAPSPAATSSLAIAKMVADKAEECFDLPPPLV